MQTERSLEFLLRVYLSLALAVAAAIRCLQHRYTPVFGACGIVTPPVNGACDTVTPPVLGACNIVRSTPLTREVPPPGTPFDFPSSYMYPQLP